jgi:hypothetical protein
MGHRANYVIIERGCAELYYSHWGAKTVPADIFWGPLATESFIRTNSRTEEWLDTTWAEGGIALDKDRRRALFFGDAELLDSPEMWGLFLSLASQVWAKYGWALEGGRDQADMAEFSGRPRSTVEPVPVSPRALPLAKLGENHARGIVCALIGHTSSGGFDDRVLDFDLARVLLNGPAFLSCLADLPTLDQLRVQSKKGRAVRNIKATLMRWKARLIGGAPPKLPAGAIWDKKTKGYTFSPEPYGRAITAFALLDEIIARLEIFDPYTATDLKWIRDAWPGWTVRPLGGAESYFHQTGRGVPPDLTPQTIELEESPVRSREECLAAIESHLFGAEEQKEHLSKVSQDFGDRHTEPGTVFAPGFFDEVPRLPLGERERREVWLDLLKI